MRHCAWVAQQLQPLLGHWIQVASRMEQHMGCNTLARGQGEQDVLDAEVVVAELLGFAKAQLQDSSLARREGDVAGQCALTLPDDLLHV